MSFWTFLVFLHVVAMTYFLGGQMMLGFHVVPLLRDRDREAIGAVARRFGVGTLISLGVLIVTGFMLAGHFNMWSLPSFQVKMTLVVLTVVAVVVHLIWAEAHWLMGLVFLLTLGTVLAGVNLMH